MKAECQPEADTMQTQFGWYITSFSFSASYMHSCRTRRNRYNTVLTPEEWTS